MESLSHRDDVRTHPTRGLYLLALVLAPPLATKNLIDPSIEVLRATLFVLRPHKLLNRGSQAVCASGFDRQIIAAEHTHFTAGWWQDRPYSLRK
jgi:hypothetical protein